MTREFPTQLLHYFSKSDNKSNHHHKTCTQAHMQARLEGHTAATASRADADAGSSARLFRSTQSTTLSTSNARSSLYPLLETPTPPNPPSSLPNIPQNSSQAVASVGLLFHTDQHTRVHNFEEVLHSFTMAPCVVVERLEGKQRCSRTPVGEHVGRRAQECTM